MAQTLFGFAASSMKMLKSSYFAVFAYKAILQLMQGLCKSCILLLILMSHICKNNIDGFLHFKTTYRLLRCLCFFLGFGVFFGGGICLVLFGFVLYRTVHTRIPYVFLYFIHRRKTNISKTDKGNIPRVFSSVIYLWFQRKY